MRVLRSHLVDLGPLRRSRVFRTYWIGTTVSGFGGGMAQFALLFAVWDASHSAVLTGVTGIVRAVPMTVAALVGGHLADTRNRRSLLLWSRTGQLVVAAAAAVLVLTGHHDVPVLYAVIALTAVFAGLSSPVAQTVPPMLLDGSDLAAGLAITRLSGQFSLLLGPAIGGVLVASVGVGPCLLVDVATFAAALWGIRALPNRPPAATPRPASVSAAAEMLAGLRFIVHTPVILGAFLVDICAMVLALPAALFPVINAEKFGGSPATLGLMLPAIGLGGILAGLFSGRITAAAHQGRIMLISCAVWGAATAAFGLAPSLPLALLSLVVAGAADTGTVVSRGTIVQSATPDALRGRVSSLDFLVGAGGPSIGDLRAGLVAGLTSGAVSCVLGGLACIAGAGAIGAASPRLRSWRLTPTAGSGRLGT